MNLKLKVSKFCKYCSIFKEFYKNCDRCKSCMNLKNKQWRLLNKDKLRKIVQKASRKYRNTHKEQLENYRLLVRYEMSLTEYNNLLAQQNNVCAICKMNTNRKNKLSVDHSHITKKIRGLLCSNCNRGLGYFKDSDINLNSAIEYLKAKGK